MPQLTDNLFVQDPGEPLLGAMGMTDDTTPAPVGSHRFAHVMNTYRTPPGSDADRVHQATYTSMQAARSFTVDNHAIRFLSVQFPEDRDSTPGLFQKSGDLQRSVLDLHSFSVPRKFPLLFDILQQGIKDAGDAKYLIFTNTDINLMPHFYNSIARMIDYGFDVIVVNRREIPGFSTDPGLMTLMYSDFGVSHEGYDCFVFPVQLFSRFIANQACIGAGLVMRGLLYNLLAYARKMLLLRECHLTFHLGRDQTWQAPEMKDYVEYNRQQSAVVLDELSADPNKQHRLQMFLGGSR